MHTRVCLRVHSTYLGFGELSCLRGLTVTPWPSVDLALHDCIIRAGVTPPFVLTRWGEDARGQFLVGTGPPSGRSGRKALHILGTAVPG